MCSASILLAAIALAEGGPALDARYPAVAQPVQLGDSISLVHTSVDIALEMQNKWLHPRISFAGANDRYVSFPHQVEALPHEINSDGVSPVHSSEEESCPNLYGNIYVEPVHEGESPLWQVTLQVAMESEGLGQNLAPCGKLIFRCRSLNEEVRGFIYPRTNTSNGHLFLAEFEHNSFVGAPFLANISANGSIVLGTTEFKKSDSSANRLGRDARGDASALQERLLRRARLRRESARAVQASPVDDSLICKSGPGNLGESCEEQERNHRTTITDLATCEDAFHNTIKPSSVDFQYPVEWKGAVNSSANLRGCGCWFECHPAPTSGAPGSGQLPTIPIGDQGQPGGAPRQAPCPLGEICPLPTNQTASSVTHILQCCHHCAFNTNVHAQVDAFDFQLAVCSGCRPEDMPTFADLNNFEDQLKNISAPSTPTQPPPCNCAPTDNPLCGADGQTYGNACEASCANVSVDCSGDCPCEDPSAIGDPHLTNLAGEHFDVNQPADYVLLRIPAEPSHPALLELRGQIKADAVHNACAMYIRDMTLRGAWLDNRTVQVRSQRRDMPGSNSAGNTTAWPFSISATEASAEPHWRTVGDFDASDDKMEVLSANVFVAARAGLEDLVSGAESQAFDFLVGRSEKSQANINVSQGPHQSLTVQMKNVRALGEQHIGGLLGTEQHSREVEQLTQECKAFKTSAVHDNARARATGVQLSASW